MIGAPVPLRAPEALRARVLARAREAAATASRPSSSDRIWFSRRWRLAWAGAVLVLMVLEALPMGESDSRGATAQAPLRESVAAARALGLGDDGWIGGHVVTDTDSPRQLVEEAL